MKKIYPENSNAGKSARVKPSPAYPDFEKARKSPLLTRHRPKSERDLAIKRLNAVRAYSINPKRLADIAKAAGQSTHTIKSWARKYRDNGIAGLIPKTSPFPRIKQQLKILANDKIYSAQQKEAAQKRLTILAPYLEGKSTLEQVAKTSAISVGSLYTWSTAYRKNGIRGIVPKVKNGRPRISPRVHDIIVHYGKKYPTAKPGAVQRMASAHAQREELSPPTFNTVKYYLDNIPGPERIHSIDHFPEFSGKVATRRKHEDKPKHLNKSRLQERVHAIVLQYANRYPTATPGTIHRLVKIHARQKQLPVPAVKTVERYLAKIPGPKRTETIAAIRKLELVPQSDPLASELNQNLYDTRKTVWKYVRTDYPDDPRLRLLESLDNLIVSRCDRD